TTYIVPGTILRAEQETKGAKALGAAVGQLPALENALLLRENDALIVTRDLRPGSRATLDKEGRIAAPAMIGCTLPEVFDDVRRGEPIWFDDGRIGGRIEKVDPESVLVRITHARPQGEKLRSDKGINLPESRLTLPALTSQDIEDLAFIGQNADVVELSF